MDALLISFIAAVLGTFGDKAQRVVAGLAARDDRPAPILAGALLATLTSTAIAVAAGAFLHMTVTLRALSLLLALSLISAGVGGFFPARTSPAADRGRLPLAAEATAALLAVSLGDRVQFMAGAIAALYGAPLLTAAGTMAGIGAALVPAALLGGRLESALPIRAVRLGGACCFLLIGAIVALRALRLI